MITVSFALQLCLPQPPVSRRTILDKQTLAQHNLGQKEAMNSNQSPALLRHRAASSCLIGSFVLLSHPPPQGLRVFPAFPQCLACFSELSRARVAVVLVGYSGEAWWTDPCPSSFLFSDAAGQKYHFRDRRGGGSSLA